MNRHVTLNITVTFKQVITLTTVTCLHLTAHNMFCCNMLIVNTGPRRKQNLMSVSTDWQYLISAMIQSLCQLVFTVSSSRFRKCLSFNQSFTLQRIKFTEWNTTRISLKRSFSASVVFRCFTTCHLFAPLSTCVTYVPISKYVVCVIISTILWWLYLCMSYQSNILLTIL